MVLGTDETWRSMAFRRRYLALCAVSAALLVGVVAGAPRFAFDAWGNARPATGMSILEGHPCLRAEKKRVLVRGVEDGFSSLGEEAGRRRSDLPPASPGISVRADYDSATPDAAFADYFELPARVASGVLVIRMRAIGDNSNDWITIGDASTPKDPARVFSRVIRNFDAARTRTGDIHAISFKALKLDNGDGFLDFINGSDEDRTVDVIISDDTSVDFIGAAYCEPPQTHGGLTLEHDEGLRVQAPDFAVFGCDGAAGFRCDPFLGDASCDDEFPMLCFRDAETPAPKAWLGHPSAGLFTRGWSGGEVAGTAPVLGRRFQTIDEADGYCATEFGEGWRVAEWHLGGSTRQISAAAGGRPFSGRYWIDIRGQPYATCWGRNDD
jgi:hypothetical protein